MFLVPARQLRELEVRPRILEDEGLEVPGDAGGETAAVVPRCPDLAPVLVEERERDLPVVDGNARIVGDVSLDVPAVL